VCTVTFCKVADCHITLEYEKSITVEPQITITDWLRCIKIY